MVWWKLNMGLLEEQQLHLASVLLFWYILDTSLYKTILYVYSILWSYPPSFLFQTPFKISNTNIPQLHLLLFLSSSFFSIYGIQLALLIYLWLWAHLMQHDHPTIWLCFPYLLSSTKRLSSRSKVICCFVLFYFWDCLLDLCSYSLPNTHHVD